MPIVSISRQNSITHSRLVMVSTLYSWRRITDTAPPAPTSLGSFPSPRSGAASVVVKDFLFLFGGYGGHCRLMDFYSYHFPTQTWSEISPINSIENRPGVRENNGVIVCDSDANQIFIFGGYNGRNWLNDLWSYDIAANEWTCVQQQQNSAEEEDPHNNLPRPSSQVPAARFGYYAALHNKKFILFGGYDGVKWLNDLWEFDLRERRWMLIEELGGKAPPNQRSCPSYVKDVDKLYVFGGYDGVTRMNDFFVCDLNTYEWSEIKNFGSIPSPRYFHSCALHDGKIYVFGGYSGTDRLKDLYSFDLETSHWAVLNCTNGSSNGGDIPSGRSSLVSEVWGNGLYVFGGYSGENVLNDMFEFKLTTRVSVPPSGLVSDMQRMLRNDDLCDVAFSVGEEIIRANKAILSARSEFFMAMFFSGMRESQKGVGGVEKPIVIEGISSDVFKRILEFLYTDTVGEGGYIELLIASERFFLGRLKSICELNIRNIISVGNCVEIFMAAHLHNALDLKEVALAFIVGNLNSVKMTENFKELTEEPNLLLEAFR